MDQIRSLLPTGTGAYRDRSLPAQAIDALVTAVLLVVAGVLLCGATIYLALHAIAPTLAPVQIHERVSVWYRFSQLAIQEVRSRR